jgi:hypothetical protein
MTTWMRDISRPEYLSSPPEGDYLFFIKNYFELSGLRADIWAAGSGCAFPGSYNNRSISSLVKSVTVDFRKGLDMCDPLLYSGPCR